MLLSDAIEGFLLDRDGESDDDLSPHTLTLYRKCLTQFTRQVGDQEVSRLTSAQLAAYMTYLEKEYKTRDNTKLSGYARDNHWKALRSFFRWASKELHFQRPDTDLARPAFAEEEVIPFSEDEVRKLLEACEFTRQAKTNGRKAFRMKRPTAGRDRAILLLLLETGIRVGELARLKIGDVNLTAAEIHIHPYRTGKKSKSRTIPFEKVTKKALWHYKTTERKDALSGEPFFPVAAHSVQSLMQRLEARTGIANVHAHRFRHTFAIQYLRNGGDIFTLQRILGHSSLEMCRRYLAIAQTDVKDAHRRASPVDRWRL